MEKERVFKYRGFRVYLTESLTEDETDVMRRYLDCLRDGARPRVDDKLIDIHDETETDN